jgi:hypothetical protein
MSQMPGVLPHTRAHGTLRKETSLKKESGLGLSPSPHTRSLLTRTATRVTGFLKAFSKSDTAKVIGGTLVGIGIGLLPTGL